MLLASSTAALEVPPLWTVAPFALLLASIAITPLVFPHWWESNRNKGIIAAALSVPVILYLLFMSHEGSHWLVHSVKEYVAFMALLTSLFVISGGVYLRGSLSGTPLVNTAFMAIGGLIASFIGTTGASMLLIRPMLRANKTRERKVHIVVFFIFIVSNGAGMLTPLGDPPLFLGFLRGVPFLWTLQLFLPWLMVNGALLVLFNIMDQMVLNKEELDRPGSQLEDVQHHEPLGIDGGLNALWMLGVVAVIFVIGAYGDAIHANKDVQLALQVGGMTLLTVISLLTTKTSVREANKFGWGAIIEVAVLFAGIFVTMTPALKVLEAQGAGLGVTQPWHFFWASGVLSSFLDNAPTYLTFATVAVGVVNTADPSAHLTADNLAPLAAHPTGALLLMAVSCGSVFMGANTYIGNGPNFMVKAIAEENGVKMPSFLGYMLWSGAILIPMFVLTTFVFFMQTTP
jgi:Na+/H+ antiporter NhaD/arsenite permease-like protein